MDAHVHVRILLTAGCPPVTSRVCVYYFSCIFLLLLNTNFLIESQLAVAHGMGQSDCVVLCLSVRPHPGHTGLSVACAPHDCLCACVCVPMNQLINACMIDASDVWQMEYRTK